MGKLVDITEYYDKNVGKINRLILKCSPETLSKLEVFLPNEEEMNSPDITSSWRYGYLMDYFMGVNIADDLEKSNQNDKQYIEYIENIRFRTYILFLRENYSKKIFYYEEFLTLSRLLYEVMNNKELINNDFKEKLIDNINQNSPDAMGLVYDIIHEMSDNNYEIDKNKLRIVNGRISSMRIDLIDEEVDQFESKKSLVFKPEQKNEEE